jgi:hypothetical protein
MSIEEAFGKAIVQQQGHVKPSVVDLLTEIRDEIRAMRKIAEARKPYETKQEKTSVKYKGQFENTGAMEVPETKNGQ